jgi:uncharacterized membrane protein YphA (DoxX/SURF4 family)
VIVTALVLLRVASGWHFYAEGAKKGDRFSSQGFLRQAVGPLAPLYHRQVPDFYDFDRLTMPLTGQADKDGRPVDVRERLAAADSPLKAWQDEVVKGWGGYLESAKQHYGYADDSDASRRQQARAQAVLAQQEQKLNSAVAAAHEELEAIAQQIAYLSRLRQSPSRDDVPFERQRLAQKQAQVAAPLNALRAEGQTLDREFKGLIWSTVATDKQRNAARGPVPEPVSLGERIDAILPWFLMAVGGLLMVGLLTRVAAVGAGVFLLSIMASQPPWVPGAELAVFHYQLVELCGLAVLAAVGAGRWAGLDYFIYRLCTCCRGSKEPHDARETRT